VGALPARKTRKALPPIRFHDHIELRRPWLWTSLRHSLCCGSALCMADTIRGPGWEDHVTDGNVDAPLLAVPKVQK